MKKKILSLLMIMAIIAGVVFQPVCGSMTAEAKKYKETITLEEGKIWACSGYYEWKNTDADIAYGTGSLIFGVTEGKTTITGKDKNNDKYIYNLEVIKPIGLQIKKVDITKNKVKYTIKNLSKKAVKFGKKVSFCLEDAAYRYYANIDKDVTIKPKETKVLIINSGKNDGNEKYTFKDEFFNEYFDEMTFNITYENKDLEYVLPTKPVKNTAKRTPVISRENEWMSKGEEHIISMLNTDKKVNWSILSGEDVIKIQEKGKHYVTIKATGTGEAKLQAKVGGKKYKSTITVYEE